MIETEKITIGIPTFNRAGKLKTALESVLKQSYQNLDILVSDNNSTDDTSSLVESYASRDSRIIYNKHDNNIGAIANFLSLYKRNSNKYFMWLSDDDYLDSIDYIEKCMAFHRLSQDYALVSGVPVYHINQEFIRYGRKVNLTDDDPECRSIKCYKYNFDNGIFYGIYNTTRIPKVIMPNSWAGDQTFINSIAYYGKIKTLDNIYIMRSIDGASSNLSRVIATLNLPKIQYFLPYYTMTLEVFTNAIRLKRDEGHNSFPKNTIFALSCAWSYLSVRFLASTKYSIKLIFKLFISLFARN